MGEGERRVAPPDDSVRLQACPPSHPLPPAAKAARSDGGPVPSRTDLKMMRRALTLAERGRG
ncbi:MAG TPA: hypothetical protein VM841_02335, partial [Actinomycetota bacterium]|nr:hypothetical protein [Actinomycetota bacterium]